MRTRLAALRKNDSYLRTSIAVVTFVVCAEFIGSVLNVWFN